MTPGHRRYPTGSAAKARFATLCPSAASGSRSRPIALYFDSFADSTDSVSGALDAETSAALQRMLDDATRITCGRRPIALMRAFREALLGAFLAGGDGEWARVHAMLAEIEADLASEAVTSPSRARIRAFLNENADLAGPAVESTTEL